MKIIRVKNFGNVLVSRPAGQEAFNGIRQYLNPDETIQVDFEGILTVTPSWLDEFLTRLTDFNHGKVELLPTNNASILAALPVLAIARKDAVADAVNKLLEKIGNK